MESPGRSSMTSYYGFDGISEPGRRPQPMFMRRTKARRSRGAIILSVLCVSLLVWGWRSSGIGIVRSLRCSTDSSAHNVRYLPPRDSRLLAFLPRLKSPSLRQSWPEGSRKRHCYLRPHQTRCPLVSRKPTPLSISSFPPPSRVQSSARRCFPPSCSAILPRP